MYASTLACVMWGAKDATIFSGTYDAASKRFVLTWKSLIVGGPFDSFIGSWHLEGTFEPKP